MQAANWAAWRDNPETKALLAYLRRRQAGVVQTFLAGNPVDPKTQGQAAAFHELEKLLTAPVDKLKEALETALKEPKTP